MTATIQPWGSRRRTRRRPPALVTAVLALLLTTGACAVARGGAGGTSEGDRAGPAATRSARRACGVSTNLVPACGAWLGIWPRTRGDGVRTTDLRSNLASIEGRLGHRLALVSRYYGWHQLPVDATDIAWRDQGHLLLIDLRARDFGTDTYVSWRSIADGAHDEYLRAVARRLRSLHTPVFFSFNQEPEQELERGASVAGGAEDFAAAYRHVHDVVVGAGAINVRWVWWVMGSMGHRSWYPRLYPGDRYVDWISYDPYDFNACHATAARTPRETVLPFLHWLEGSGLGAGKPVMLSEFGSHGAQRGSWYRALGAVVEATPRIRALVSFDSLVAGCDTRVTASADDWRGFRALARDPYFRPVVPFRPPGH